MKLNVFNKKNDNYTILLQGVIGEEINGYLVASDINTLNEMGVDKIQIRINSIGGNVYQAYSVLSEMQKFKGEIETINVGVAYSCASWLLAAGTKGKRKAKNYSSVMIHNAEGSHSEAASVNTNSIKTILSELTGRDEEIISNEMNVETFYEGDKQMKMGFVDSIIPTSKMPVKANNVYELMNIYKVKSNKMDKVLNKLGATDEAGALLKLAEVDNAHKLEVENLKNEKADLVLRIEELENKITENTKASVESIVNKAIEDGKCAEDSRESMLEIGNTLGIEKLNEVFKAVKTQHVDVNNLLGGSGKQGKEEKKWEDYSLEERKEMKHKNPELFNKLIEDFQNR